MNKYEPHKHHRRSIRLKGYDYSQAGAYFVTICVQNGECLLGEIVDGEMIPNPASRMVQQIWNEIPGKFPTVELDAFVIMPNHIHFILLLSDPPADSGIVGVDPRVNPQARSDIGQARGPAPTDATKTPKTTAVSLPDVVQWFKSLTTAKYRHGVRDHGWPRFPGRFWQRNYYEHIIRNNESLENIRVYIYNNPAAWNDDQLNPVAPINPFNRRWKRDDIAHPKE